MKNRINVTIAGKEYTLLAEEDAAYTRKVAAHVDDQLREVQSSTKVSLTDAVILAALNIADEYYKEAESAESLRKQIKDILEESSRTKLELAEARREIFRLQNRK